MATPSSGGDSDKAIPQSLFPPSLTEYWAWPPQEDIVDQSPCSALLQQELLPGESDKAIPDPPSLPWLRVWLAWLEQDEQLLRQEFVRYLQEVELQEFDQLEIDQFVRQEDVDVVDQMRLQEAEEVETRSEGRGEGAMEDGHLNFARFLFKGKRKGKRKVRSPRGEERGNKKTIGARIEIPLDDILQVGQMRLREAARHLKVSASSLMLVCREYGIHRWPPRMGKNCINQSGPTESLLAVDQEGIAQQRPDTPRSSNTNSVIIKARYVKDCTIKFQLPRPWVMVELEQQVQKRLKLEAGTYYIKYKNEDNDLIIIACDEDLQDYISSSSPRGTTSIEVFLVPK